MVPTPLMNTPSPRPSGWLLSGLLLVSPAVVAANPVGPPTAAPAPSEPRAHLHFEPSHPSPGEPFDLVVEATWNEADRPVALAPPHFESQHGVTRHGVTRHGEAQHGAVQHGKAPRGTEILTVRTTSSDGGEGVRATWRMTLTTERAGTLRLPSLHLSWETPTGPGHTILHPPSVQVGGTGGPGSALVAAAGLGGLGVLAMLAWGRWRRPRAGTPASPSLDEDRRQRLEAAWREARRRRMAGDRAAAVERLVELERKLGGLGLEAPSVAGESLEEIRYGGRLPSGPELDQLERRVERALAALRPDPEEPRRRSLGLGEHPGAGELERRPS